MLRILFLTPLLALCACATTAAKAPEAQFVFVDTTGHKSDADKQRAALIAQNDCKVKALSASAAIEKSIGSERNSMENFQRARDKGAEMYTSTYTLCMLNAGFVKR